MIRKKHRWIAGIIGCAFTTSACGDSLQGVTPGAASLGSQTATLQTLPTYPGCALDPNLVNPAVLYVATNGNDANSGAIDTPVASLSGAMARIPTNFTTDYQVLVRGGEYRAQTVVWDRLSKDHRVHIAAYPGETPVFNGLATGATLTTLPWFLELKLTQDRADNSTNFILSGLTVKNYAKVGVLLDGNGNTGARLQSCGTFIDNTLVNIGDSFAECTTVAGDSRSVINRSECTAAGATLPGDRWGCLCQGLAGFDAMGSSKNLFLNNKIINSVNGAAQLGKVHAFYLYVASNNAIKDNYIRNDTGQVVKFRNASNDNVATRNYLERAGNGTFFADTPSTGEQRSTNNVLDGNVVTYTTTGATGTLAACSGNATSCVTANPVASFIGPNGTNISPVQTAGKLFQPNTPSIELPTAITSADINGDGREEVFVALYYPNEGFTKVVYSEGGSRELSEIAYTSTIWRVNHLVAGDFGGQGVSVVANFYNVGSGVTQVAGGARDADGKYKLGTGSILLNNNGANGWKITAMAAGKVAGAAHPLLFSGITSGGVQQIVRGDGFSNEAGGSHPGFSDNTLLYSSSNWEIPAMTTGNIDGTGVVKLITAFYHITGTIKTAVYLGSGAGSDGANDGGLIFENTADKITALTTGKFDGTQEQLISGFDSGGIGKIYLSTGPTPINVKGASLYSSSSWAIAAVTRAEVSTGLGDELVSAFDKFDATQIWAGNGTTGALNDGEAFYRWP
jgi:hypothetical protein